MSSPGGVVLEEARQGDMTTVTQGEIRLRGSTGTAGVGVGIGGLGLGVASSETSLSGTLNSEGKTTVGKDKARDIDSGQLTANENGLTFIGNLQTRSIPLEDVLGVARDFHVLLISAKSLPTTQRFRFLDRFAAELFEHAINSYMQTKEFPATSALIDELGETARGHVTSLIKRVEEKIRGITVSA